MAADTQPKYTVAIAVDQSEYSRHAVEFYCNFVHKPEYKLLVLHTATQMYQTALTAAAGSLSQGNAMAALPASHWTQMAQEQKEKVRQLKHKYDPLFEEKSVQRHWRVIETTASPGEAIVASAEDAGACLIVVGSRGQGALRRTILGSVSDYVLHHAKVPVMISHGDH